MKKSIFNTIFTIAIFTAQFALASQPMLRLEVKEHANSESPTEIQLRIPFGLLEAMKPTIEDALKDMDFAGHGDVDLKSLWQQVKNAGPNDYVNVSSNEGTVAVSTTETNIVIKVDQDEEKVNITLPLALGDAFFSGDQIDFDQVLQALADLQGQELLNVSSDDVEIKAWVE